MASERFSREAQFEAFSKIRAGDTAAREEFIVENMGLARHFGVQWARLSGRDMDDCIGAATEGLIRAVDRFDPSHGVKFSTYAWFWIGQQLQREIKGMHRASVGFSADAIGRQALAEMRGMGVDIDEVIGSCALGAQIADRIGVTPQRLLEILRAMVGGLSFNVDEVDSLVGLPSCALDLGMSEIRDMLDRILDDPTASEVLVLKFGLLGTRFTIAEIADLLHLPAGKVRSIAREATSAVKAHGDVVRDALAA